MNEKPEALRLAEELTMNCHVGTQKNAATELRRQHDEIERLKADAKMMQWLIDNDTAWSWNPSPYSEGLIGGFAAFSTGYFGFDLKTAVRKAMQNSVIDLNAEMGLAVDALKEPATEPAIRARGQEDKT